MERVAVPVPSAEEFNLVTSSLSPWVTISEWRVQAKCDNAQAKEEHGTYTAKDRVLPQANTWNTSNDIVVNLTSCNDSKVESWEVVVEEQLTLHEIERKVVECPSENHSTNLIVKSFENGVTVVLETTLPSEDREAFEDNKDYNGQGRAPPDDRVTDEIDLAVVLTPEVDTTS